ncbi:MAG TPA: type IV pilus assembly protein PilM [Verrucomicrobiae bacterium]|nr:type IV pilus assembly protein PilM [Verrucomicrobiae bacterium]
MLRLLSDKKLKAFGLDISDLSIKVMQLNPVRRQGLFPIAYSNVGIPQSIITNHMIAKPEKLADSVNRAVALAKNVDTKFVVANVPEAKSFVRILKIPKMHESEIEGAIPWELEQDIPVPIDQVYLDWQVISQDAENTHVLVTAAPKDYIDSLVDSLKLAGLKPVALELESQATARALVGKDDAQEAILILDMSMMQTSFIIANAGILEYTSSIPIAGSAFTESIARTLGIPASEAEKIKRESGLLTDSKRGNIRQAMLPILDNVVDEIKNVVRFYEEHTLFGKQISGVYLTGGAAKLSGLVDYITARLNLGSGKPLGRIALGNPWVNVCSEELQKSLPINKEAALDFTTAIGLAMRGVNYENN